MEASIKIQAIINTLSSIKIEATDENLLAMIGAKQALAEVRDELKEREQAVEVKPAGGVVGPLRVVEVEKDGNS